MRLTQSMVFLRSGGTELLYSGVETKTPWCAARRRPSFRAFSGMPFSFSKSPL